MKEKLRRPFFVGKLVKKWWRFGRNPLLHVKATPGLTPLSGTSHTHSTRSWWAPPVGLSRRHTGRRARVSTTPWRLRRSTAARHFPVSIAKYYVCTIRVLSRSSRLFVSHFMRLDSHCRVYVV